MWSCLNPSPNNDNNGYLWQKKHYKKTLFKVQFEVDYKIEVNLILYKAYFQPFVSILCLFKDKKVYCMVKWMSNWDCLCKLWREWKFWDYAIMLSPNGPLILHWHWDWEGETEGIRERCHVILLPLTPSNGLWRGWREECEGEFGGRKRRQRKKTWEYKLADKQLSKKRENLDQAECVSVSRV